MHYQAEFYLSNQAKAVLQHITIRDSTVESVFDQTAASNLSHCIDCIIEASRTTHIISSAAGFEWRGGHVTDSFFNIGVFVREGDVLISNVTSAKNVANLALAVGESGTLTIERSTIRNNTVQANSLSITLPSGLLVATIGTVVVRPL